MTPYRHPLTQPQRALILVLIVLGHAGVALILWQFGLQQVFVREASVAEALALTTQTQIEAAPVPLPQVTVKPPLVVVVSEVQAPSFEAPLTVASAEQPASVVAATRPEAARTEPKTQVQIPASEVRYQVPPPVEYPRVSRRLREAGHVIVRVFVDERGQPRIVQVRTSSGFARLDAAAISAVQRARFVPYTENGVPTAGWAVIPLDFILDT